MPLRPRGLPRPPSVEDPKVTAYLESIRQALEGLPLSYFSTSDGPNTSGVTAPRGTLGVEIGDSSKTRLWFKEDDSSATTGWEAVSLDDAYGTLHHRLDQSVHTQSGITTAFQQYVGFDTVGVASKMSTDATASYVTVQDDGVYESNFDISFEGTNNTEWDFELFKNGADQNYGSAADTGSAGDKANSAFHSLVTASSGDTLAVYVKTDDAGGADLTTFAANFIVKEVNTF